MLFFWRLACTCEETWPPNVSLYASSTCVHLRLLAAPFGQGFSKCGFSSYFHLAKGLLLSFSWSKTNVSWNPLPIWTCNIMNFWGMVSDRVIDVSAGWILRVLSVFNGLLASSLTFSVALQKAMATIKNDVIEGDVWLWLRHAEPLRFLWIDREWSQFVLLFS